MYYIYWIKRKSHNNVLTEGYVGFSNNVERQFEEHKSATSKVGKAIKKYSDVEVITLYKFKSKQEALDKEKELRPEERIGWNIAIGGQVPPLITKEAAQKISQTLKRKKISPYCEKTHSPESLEKAKLTKIKANRKMYHNPITGDYRFVALGLGEPIPEGWIPGRVKKIKSIAKVRGVDYSCNTMHVNIFKNGILFENNVKNLKDWCKKNNIKYFAGSRTNSIKVLTNTKTVFIDSIIVNNEKLIIENGINTGLKCHLYAKSIGKSSSYISYALKKGSYTLYQYDVFSFKRLIANIKLL